MQGFPDYHVLLARPSAASRPMPRFIRSVFHTQRYQVCALLMRLPLNFESKISRGRPLVPASSTPSSTASDTRCGMAA